MFGVQAVFRQPNCITHLMERLPLRLKQVRAQKEALKLGMI